MARSKSTAPEAQSRPSVTRADLLKEVRDHRAPDSAHANISLARVREMLALMLDALLESFDYRSQQGTAPAFYARCIAAVLADIEDTQAARGEVLQ